MDLESPVLALFKLVWSEKTTHKKHGYIAIAQRALKFGNKIWLIYFFIMNVAKVFSNFIFFNLILLACTSDSQVF